jgi:hypothetical protein
MSLDLYELMKAIENDGPTIVPCGMPSEDEMNNWQPTVLGNIKRLIIQL